jgi:hypothetical protein
MQHGALDGSRREVPAVGTRVSVLGSTSDGPGVALGALLARNVVTQAVTDAAGHYSLSVPGGSYNLVAGEAGTIA